MPVIDLSQLIRSGQDRLTIGGGTFLGATITELRGADVSLYTQAITAGLLSPGDAAGGVWAFDAGDLSGAVAADPQGGVYVAPDTAPTGASGAWVRQHDGFLDVHWFGAKGDSTTDDGGAIQAALNLAGYLGGGEIRLRAHTYRTTAALNITSSYTSLVGPRSRGAAQIHLDSATATALNIDTGGGSDVQVRDLAVTCFLKGSPDTRTNGTGITITNTGDYLLENLWVRHGWDSVYLNGPSTGIIRNVHIDDGAAAVNGGGLQRGIVITNTTVSTRIVDCVITETISDSVALAGIDVDTGTDTLRIVGTEVGGFAYGIRLQNTGAAHDPRWVRITDTYIEPIATSGIGVSLDKCYDVELKGVYTKGGQNGIHTTANSRAVRILGGVVQLAQQYGILVDGGDGVTIAGTLVTDNGEAASGTYDGIAIGSTGKFHVQGVRSGNILWNGSGGQGGKQRYGVNVTQPTAADFSLIGVSGANNLSGVIQNASTATSQLVLSLDAIGANTGLVMGDASLYRPAANQLQTDDLLVANGAIYLVPTPTAPAAPAAGTLAVSDGSGGGFDGSSGGGLYRYTGSAWAFVG